FHEVKDSQSYEAVLKEAGVSLRPEDRAATIEEQLATVAKEVQGQVLHDPELLEEVTFLVEMPQAFAGSFDPEFLAVPREVTVTAMRSHQRYFAVEDASGKLLPHFLVVADGRWDDASQVIAGNERVLRARLSDARFYWDVDLKTGLDGLADALKSVVWLEGLGTLADKSERVAKIMVALGPDVAGDAWSSLTQKAPRAAKVAKADLASEMIKDGKEFTGLQGVIGARYGEALGEDPEVCQALAQQYLPRGSKDPLPESELGLLLALADRFDTIAGCWAAGFVPTGSQDPYGLRRAGNGIVRILLEKSRVTSLSEAIKNALQNLPGDWNREALGQEIASFFRERLAFHLRERSISYDVVDAVLEVGADHPVDALARAKALQAVRGEAELERLVIGYKRAANILKGINASDIESFDGLDWSGAEPAEEALRQAVTQATPKVLQLNQDAKYPEMLQELLTLREPIDTFFDDVMVMSEDPKQKARRVSLLNQVRLLFQNLCDLSCIVIEGE
ncbi:MAG: glycine--tRNA ligase subunit beta, partial [Candidatus Eisenbacteria bacterium]|nr:glycine--tRNA ligase subunit beta [Candidatus Eisenbacteria bacterium]